MRATLGIVGTVLLFGTFANVAGSDAPSAPQEFTVAEDAAPGADIGRVSEQTENSAEPPAATYSIAHDGRSIPFVIDPQTGALTLADSPLDYERQSRHEFTVRARRPRVLDAARRAYLADLIASGVEPETIDELLFEVTEHVVAVNVADSPEPPVLSPATLQLVIEDSGKGARAQLVANDPDAGDTQTFELIAGDSGQFQIDPQTGVLHCPQTDTAVAGSFPVTVRVTDTTGLSDAATFNVEVIVPPAAVAASTPEVLPEDPAPSVEPAEPAVTILPEPPSDDAQPAVEAIAPAPETVVADTDPIESEPSVPPEPEDAVAHPVATPVSPPVAAAAPQDSAITNLAGEAAATTSQTSFARWLPLLFVLLAIGVGAVWYLRRRSEREHEATPAPFRVVREAPVMAAPSITSPGTPSVKSDEELTASRLASLEADAADKAVLHRLMAAAFQQASVPTPVAAPQPPARNRKLQRQHPSNGPSTSRPTSRLPRKKQLWKK
jgi:hypothetical protein